MAKAKKVQTKEPVIFSTNAVRATAILCGPWSAAFMFYKNFKAINQPRYARVAVLVGALIPVILIGIPYAAPRTVVFAVYIGIVLFLVERYQKAVERAHAKMRGSFYPSKTALKVAVVGLALYLVPIFLYVAAVIKNIDSDISLKDGLSIVANSDFDTDSYDKQITIYEDKEGELITLVNGVLDDYEKGGTDAASLTDRLDKVLIILDSELAAIDSAGSTPNLPSYYKNQLKDVNKYITLRREQIIYLKSDIQSGVPNIPRYNEYESNINSILH